MNPALLAFALPVGIKQKPQLMCVLPQAARLEQQQQRDHDEQQQQLEAPAGEILLAVKPASVSEAACWTVVPAAGCGPEGGDCHSCAVLLCHAGITCVAAGRAGLTESAEPCSMQEHALSMIGPG